MKYFKTLQNQDVFSAKISDHHPVMHDNVLFWNIMMQAKKRGEGYNNGFGMVESDEAYLERLRRVADVIAEIVGNNPNLIAINLCEGPISSVKGPITSLAVNTFITALQQHKAMHKFSKLPHCPNVPNALHWGLMMFADKRFAVTQMPSHFIPGSVMYTKLSNRFQIWQLTDEDKIRYIALAHFPFAANEHTSEKEKLSSEGKKYADYLSFVLSEYQHLSLILCADFNLNPFLIGEWKERELDKIPAHNSILLSSPDKEIKPVTVDGILLSLHEKQRFYHARFPAGLFTRLKLEYNLMQDVSRNMFMV